MTYTQIIQTAENINARLDDIARLKRLGIEPNNSELQEMEDFMKQAIPSVELVEYVEKMVLCQQ